MSQVNQNDALGGAGSLAKSLQSIAINGLSRATDGYLSRKYPLTSFNEQLTVEGGGAYEASYGPYKPRSAPQKNVSATSAARPIYSNPVFLAVGGALLVGVILLVAMKR